RPDQDLDLARLEHGLEIRPQEAQLRRRQAQLRRAGFAGRQDDLRDAFELEHWARDARDRVAYEQEHGFLRLASTRVRHVDGDFDHVFAGYAFRRHAQVRVRETAVGQAEAEGEQRRIRRVEILARETILRVLGAAAVALAVKQRNLTERVRPGDRHSPTRRNPPREDVGHGIAGL